ncbi:MAG: response regulator [Eubacteriales bacterium]|nr:response regulator [Eubacteriales bacterium]
MIFKLLVVDDEATMRKGIANFINWSSIDCEVAGTASDGVEAIQFLETHSVDIVITDIKMPEADGLEIAKYIYENHLEIKVLILTGYADFQYAQTAIRYNVSSFILKPTNKKELMEAVQEAQKDLIVSKKNSSIEKEELAFLKDQLLQELTAQPLTPELDEKLKKLNISLEHYYIAAFQLVPVGEDITALKNIIISEKHNAYCYRYNNLIITIYFLDKPCRGIPEDILDNCREIIEIARTLASKNAAAGISRFHSKAAEFGTAVSEAIYALTLNFYSEGSISRFTSPIDGNSYDLTAENSMDLFQFENSLNNWQFEDSQAILNNIFMKFKSNLVQSRDVKNICSQIYYICSRVLIKREASPLPPEYLTRLHASSDIFSLEEATLTLMDCTKENLLGLSGSQNKLVENAVKYIHCNLAKPLSLEVIAEQLHISPSHLSRTFKKVCEESLTEYVNKARIEKAREYLMKSDVLAYEIAELVGYNDPTYFSSIFKKYTGLSPTEYRQQMRGR